MAKKLKLKIPKRVAGVKIPKIVRKGPVASFLNSGAGQVLIAEVLVVLGGALTAKGTDADSPAGRALKHPVDTLKQIASGGSAQLSSADLSSERIAAAFGAAVKAFKAELTDSSEAAEITRPAGDRGKKNASERQGPEKSSTPH
jgi:hypothetical protein